MATHTLSHRLKIVRQNPMLMVRKFRNQIRRKLTPTPADTCTIDINGYHLQTFPHQNDWWKQVYLKHCDIEVEDAIRRFTRPGSTYIDVGAGDGYFCAIASQYVGETGHVIGFEPSPLKLPGIREMACSHPDSRITIQGFGLGDREDEVEYYVNNGGWPLDSMVSERKQEADKVYVVPIRRLDTYLLENKIDNVSCIKIDVEGFEYYVLLGLEQYLTRTKIPPTIVCEINIFGYEPHTMLSLSALHDLMTRYGYQAYSIFDYKTAIELRALTDVTDVIFLR